MKQNNEEMQAPVRYADEVLCANWHPLVAVLAEARAKGAYATPETVDAEALLARLYSSQQA